MHQTNSNKTAILCIIDILKKHTDVEHTLNQKQIQDILESEYNLKLDLKAINTDLFDISFEVVYSERIRKAKNGEDETVDVSVKLNESAMFHWAMQYETYVEVLEPETLRTKIADAVKAMNKKYNG